MHLHRAGRTMLLLLVAAAATLSCGSAAPPGSTPEPIATPLTSRALVHVLDVKADTIRAYEVSADSGRLRAMAETAAGKATVIAADPQGQPLYTWTANGLGASYSVDTGSGSLTLLAERTTFWDEKPRLMAFTAERLLPWNSYVWYGSHVHVTSWIDAYERRRDGVWIRKPPPELGGYRNSVGIKVIASPASSRVFVLVTSDESSGLLTYGLTPDGRFEYVASAFNLGDTTRTGFDVAIRGGRAGAIVGSHLVISGCTGGCYRPSDGVLASFAIEAEGGVLRGEALVPNAIPSFPPSAGPLRLIAGSDGWLAQIAGDAIRMFRIDAGGAILTGPDIPVGATPAGVAFHPSGQFLYVSMDTGLMSYQLANDSWIPFAFDPGVPAGPLVVTAG